MQRLYKRPYWNCLYSHVFISPESTAFEYQRSLGAQTVDRYFVLLAGLQKRYAKWQIIGKVPILMQINFQKDKYGFWKQENPVPIEYDQHYKDIQKTTP